MQIINKSLAGVSTLMVNEFHNLGINIYKHIFNSIKDMILILDCSGKILIANDEVEYEALHYKKDGSAFNVEVKAACLDMESDRYIISVIRDITERKKIMTMLDENEERSRLALEISSTGVWDYSFDTKRLFLSESFHKILGYEKNELPAELEKFLAIIHPEDVSEVSKYASYDMPGCVIRLEYRVLDKWGKYKWLYTIGKVVRSSEDVNSARMIGASVDVTMRKNKEQELKEKYEELVKVYEKISAKEEALRNNYELLESAKEEAEAANRAKSQFLANMSH
jgi:PAS domain S-box-containing protein